MLCSYTNFSFKIMIIFLEFLHQRCHFNGLGASTKNDQVFNSHLAILSFYSLRAQKYDNTLLKQDFLDLILYAILKTLYLALFVMVLKPLYLKTSILIS